MAPNIGEDGRPWSNSEGGPVLVIPAELAGSWRGTDPPVGVEAPPGWTWGDSGGPVCDYDRICDIDDAVGTPYGGFGALAVADGFAIALDSEIHTIWHAKGTSGGTFVRPAGDEDAADPDKPMEWKPLPGAPTLKLTDGRLFFFDSAAAGDADPEKIDCSSGVGIAALEPGTYSVEVATDEEENDYVRLTKR